MIRMRKVVLIFTLAILAFGSLIAQDTYHQDNENQYFRFGIELLDKENYSAAREQFEQYIEVGNDEIKKADVRILCGILCIKSQ